MRSPTVGSMAAGFTCFWPWDLVHSYYTCACPVTVARRDQGSKTQPTSGVPVRSSHKRTGEERHEAVKGILKGQNRQSTENRLSCGLKPRSIGFYPPQWTKDRSEQ